MIANLRRVETAAGNESPAPETSCSGAPMVTERAHCSELKQRDPSGRRLRNWLIAANTIAWVAIIVLIRLIFF
jgi:hypothetical protein